MRRILLLYILLSVVGLTTVHAQFNPGRQQIDENGYDQYGNQVDPAMIPDRLDSANVEVKGLPPTLYMWRIKNQLGDRTIIPADTAYHHVSEHESHGRNHRTLQLSRQYGVAPYVTHLL